MMRRVSHLPAWTYGIAALLVACSPTPTTQPTRAAVEPVGGISGRVVEEGGGSVVGATVRVKTTENWTETGADGSFTLIGLQPEESVDLTAWAGGYFIVAQEGVPPGTTDLEMVLHPHHDTDHSEYTWLPSQYHPGQGEDQGCAKCHSDAAGDLAQNLPVDEWLMDAHGQAALNPRFLSMYTGTDLDGNQSPATRYASNRDYGRFPLRPDPSLPYFGPGYKLDFPDTNGNCAACHTPAASVNDPYGVDPTTVSGVATEGVPCDFCHKVWDVKLDGSGMPYPNMPGVLSFEFRRPPEGHQFFAGPLDDVAPGEDTYSPLQRRGQFCASCHFGVFWDTVIYNSYGEWLESPYSDPESGSTCQDCHMPPLGNAYFALPEAGGAQRDPATIFSHRMPGASDEALLQHAVSMKVKAEREDDRVKVEVSITNDQTGHHVPTDSPLRHMILLVDVVDASENTLELVEGPVVPEWGGQGDPAAGYYAGLPGTAYAKVLQELWTEVTPTGAYWNPTRIVSDNRLPALGSDTTNYIFTAPEQGEVRVDVKLLFRRAYIALRDQKGWEVPDVLMESQAVQLR